MKLFEFEAKNVLHKYGIATPKGNTASNSDEAEVIAKKVASNLIGSTIQGSIVRSLLVEEKLKEKSND